MVIPHPTKIDQRESRFILNENTVILTDPENQGNAVFLQTMLSSPTGYPFTIQAITHNQEQAITLQIGALPDNFGSEGYRLSITPIQVTITAETSAGVFYGFQTLRQLLPPEIEGNTGRKAIEWSIPCVEIEDWPRFPWRGYMLDESRHFHGMPTVKKLLDQMALLKMNRFHWHLTDDQGWRIEIRQYPRLTELGSTRPGTVTGNPFTSKSHDQKVHQGFYTQEEIREIVEYARERQILVIPEIEIPGHSSAALAAYSEYSCTGSPIEVKTRFGIFKDIYCAGKESTYTFLEQVLEEVLSLFPGPYIHIGGDESPKARWRSCPDCQQKIKLEGLPDEHALQIYFMNHMTRFCTARQRTPIIWSDAYSPEIDKRAIIHFWIGNRNKMKDAVRKGRKLINSSYLWTYLDHTYRLLPLKKSYQFEPIFRNLDREVEKNILGLEALMWGEWLPNHRRLEYQTFPRLAALAERGWSQPKTSYRSFLKRLEQYLLRLDGFDIGYASLQRSQPAWFKRIFGLSSIALPKTKISKPVKEQHL